MIVVAACRTQWHRDHGRDVQRRQGYTEIENRSSILSKEDDVVRPARRRLPAYISIDMSE